MAPLSGQFPAMPGGVRQSAPASAPSAVLYVEVRRAARAPVIEDDPGSFRRQLGSNSANSNRDKGTMIKNELAAVLLACCLAACAQSPGPPPAPVAAVPSPEAPPAPPPRVTSEAQVAPGRWDVERVRCSDLLGADDDDRAAAAMFYFGYLAAKAGIHVVDVSQIDGNIRKVMDRCAAAPNITVPQAFRQALVRRQ